MRTDYRLYASENPAKLAKAIEQGIPKALRGMVWQNMCVVSMERKNTSTTTKLTLDRLFFSFRSASKDEELENTYLKLLKESSPHEKAISRDLGRYEPHKLSLIRSNSSLTHHPLKRTFPHHEYFTDGHGIGQENLFNVLKAYSLYDPEVGYCQGLPFVVAILLLNVR